MKVIDRFKIAGSELMQNNFGNAAKALTAPVNRISELISSYNYRAMQQAPSASGFWSFNIAGTGIDQYFTYKNASSSLKAYTDCPPVSAILLQKAHAYLNGDTYVMGKDNKEAKTKEAKQIYALLNQPNPYQSGSQFKMQVYVNTMLFGYTVILPIKPAGFENLAAMQLWAIPGNMIEIEESNDLFFSYKNVQPKTIKSITLVYKNTRTPLNIDDVFIIKDVAPSFSSVLLPENRIQTLTQPINNIVGALQSRGVLIANRGPRFVISNGKKDNISTIPMTPQEKADMENQFKHFGMLNGQSQAIFTSASANVQTIGFDVKQLGLMEEVQESSSMLCIGLGFPKFLAGLSDPTFDNQATAEKALYQRFIMPESKNFDDQFNAMFNTVNYGISIVTDFREVSVLQEDRLALGEARLRTNQACEIEWLNNLITANEWLAANNIDSKGAEFDKYYFQWVSEGKIFGGKLPNTPSVAAQPAAPQN